MRLKEETVYMSRFQDPVLSAASLHSLHTQVLSSGLPLLVLSIGMGTARRSNCLSLGSAQILRVLLFNSRFMRSEHVRRSQLPAMALGKCCVTVKRILKAVEHVSGPCHSLQFEQRPGVAQPGK